MDTQKTLSIDIDTSALIQNANNAKASISALLDQLNALIASGQNAGTVFTQLAAQLQAATTVVNQMSTALQTLGTTGGTISTQLNTQLKATADAVTQTTKALKTYTDGLTSKQKAEQDDIKKTQDYNAQMLAMQTKQTDDMAKAGVLNNTAKPGTGTPPTNTNPPDADNNTNSDSGETIKQEAPIELANIPLLSGKDSKALGKIIDPPKNFLTETITDISNFFKKVDTSIVTFYDKVNTYNKNNIDGYVKIAAERDKTYEKSVDVVAGWYDKTTEAGRAALYVKRKLAIAEIGINTEQAVSGYVTATASNIKADSGLPFVSPILIAADIAAGAIEIAGAISNGVKQIQTLNSIPIDGKARGGIFQSNGMGAYLTGPGTGTSDSINARLSNGESVINARSTQMFAPILSAINQAGGGMAFNSINSGGAYAQGGLFNGSNVFNDGSTDLANTRAMNDMLKTMAANMPRQVLVVEDVQASLQNKVMLQNMSNF